MTLASWQFSAITTGTVGGTPIVAKVNTASLALIQSVTLSANYARAPDAAYPTCDAGSRAYLESPQTIPEGTTLALYGDEAAALVAAAAATWVTTAITLGSVGETAIVAHVSPGTLALVESVTLTADYERVPAPGYPVCDAGSQSYLATPQTIPEGTTLALFSDEAAALVAADAATWVTTAITLGSVGETAIVAHVSPGTLALVESVTLTADYERVPASGYPLCDAGSQSYLATPQTIPEGTTLALYSDEAAALVAAGAATYV